MWFLVALAGCKPIQAPAVGAELVIEPAAVDFGGVRLGETGTSSLTLRNDGDVAMTFDGIDAPDDLVIDDAGPFELRPGDEELRTVSWTASTIYGINEHLDLVVGGAAAARIPVTGSSAWASLEVSSRPIDFGRTNVGCEPWVDLTVNNDGTGDEALTAIEVTDSAFSVTSTDGAPLAFPLNVAALSSETLRVHYSPASEEPADGTLIIDSESTSKLAVIDLHGEGQPRKPDTRIWTVEHDEAVTGIINVNDQMLHSGPEGLDLRVAEFVRALFSTLLESGTEFRIAIVMSADGTVEGAVPYLDQSFTVDQAVNIADLMLDYWWKDNDEGLNTCLQAMAANEEWLLDESPWSDSNLNLVVINYDAEQSPENAAYYVDRYLDYKNVDDIAVHGIAGDLPGGCAIPETKWSALPSYNLYDAAAETHGAYLSICAPDWTEWGQTLAWRFTAPYVLDGAPSLSSIEVFVDGDPVSSGWSYDDVTHELMFDDPSAPAEGAELRVDYARCD